VLYCTVFLSKRTSYVKGSESGYGRGILIQQKNSSFKFFTDCPSSLFLYPYVSRILYWDISYWYYVPLPIVKSIDNAIRFSTASFSSSHIASAFWASQILFWFCLQNYSTFFANLVAKVHCSASFRLWTLETSAVDPDWIRISFDQWIQIQEGENGPLKTKNFLNWMLSPEELGFSWNLEVLNWGVRSLLIITTLSKKLNIYLKSF
jgi:hypothetical protein